MATTSPTATVPPAGKTGSGWSLPSRAVAALSGTVGLAIKIALLAIVNAFAVWAGFVLATDERWLALVVLVAATLAIDAAYLSPRAFVRADILLSPWTTSRDVTVRGGIGVDLK